MAYQTPTNFASRPVTVLGAGVLGRRIACTWVAAGYTVHVRDPSSEQCQQFLKYASENIQKFQAQTGCKKLGEYKTFEDLDAAVKEAWLVIEAIPERLDLKIPTFAQLEKSAPQDAILASNSSSYKSSEIVVQLSDAAKTRALNLHYYMPPDLMIVELMTDRVTAPELFSFLSERVKETAVLPYVARVESTGLLFNRIWAAVKREILMIMSEGVSTPAEIDSLWEEAVVKTRMAPCKAMDQVGLDTVAFIEGHYIDERGLPSSHVDFLKSEYVDKGKLGNKSASGGLYPA